MTKLLRKIFGTAFFSGLESALLVPYILLPLPGPNMQDESLEPEMRGICRLLN
jgi:hypothetical protein